VLAAPLDPRKENKGKNNVIATYLTSNMRGLAPGRICGRAIVLAEDGRDVTYDEVFEAMYNFG